MDQLSSDVAGWDILLRAYLAEFAGVEDVCLVLLTQHADHGAADVVVSSGGPQRWAELQLQQFMAKFAAEAGSKPAHKGQDQARAKLPRLALIGRRLPRRNMPRFYARGIDGKGAFVSAR